MPYYSTEADGSNPDPIFGGVVSKIPSRIIQSQKAVVNKQQSDLQSQRTKLLQTLTERQTLPDPPSCDVMIKSPDAFFDFTNPSIRPSWNLDTSLAAYYAEKDRLKNAIQLVQAYAGVKEKDKELIITAYRAFKPADIVAKMNLYLQSTTSPIIPVDKKKEIKGTYKDQHMYLAPQT